MPIGWPALLRRSEKSPTRFASVGTVETIVWLVSCRVRSQVAKKNVASFRAGDFKTAAQRLASIDTAEGAYDAGTALVMLGKYDEAVKRYDRGLDLRPGWAEAEANREIARVRAERMKAEGGVTDDTESAPDQIVYDKTRKGGADTTVAGGQPMSNEAVRAMWLKRVETRPADFLKAKFAYQLQDQPAGTPQ